MSASILALVLLAAPARAGVIAPVETVAAPVSPAGPIAPVGSQLGGSMIQAPTLGGSLDLRGGIPLLPSPAPGLVVPGLGLGFVGGEAAFQSPEKAAAAAKTQPQASAVESSPETPAPNGVAPSKKNPAIPGGVSPGSGFTPVGRERDSETGLSATDGAARLGAESESVSKPGAGSSWFSGAKPEEAAGLGRRFFDRSQDSGRGVVVEISARRPETSLLASVGGGAPSALSAGWAKAAYVPADALGGHGAAFSARGESLRDAVGSVAPGPALAPAGALKPGTLALDGSAAQAGGKILSAPSIETSAGFGSGAYGAGSLPAAPRPLALDLSGSGLIVRVRSALGSFAGSETPAALAPVLPAASAPSSTAFLERGGLLEAMSTSELHAGVSPTSPAFAGKSVPAAPAAPSSPLRRAASWWPLLLLPILAAFAARFFL